MNLLFMKRTKWSVSLRNKLSSLAMECDSCAGIDALTNSETEYIQKQLRGVVQFIDSKI